MPFTALNQATSASSNAPAKAPGRASTRAIAKVTANAPVKAPVKAPAKAPVQASIAPDWIKQDFAELPSDVTDSIVALWDGEARAFNTTTTQKVISELRELVVDLRTKAQAQTAATTASNRADTPSRKRGSGDEAQKANGHIEKKPRIAVSKPNISNSWKGTLFEGISFTIPQRKKLCLTISTSKNEGLLVSAPGSNTPEFGIPWSQIEHIICLPVPDKTSPQKSFIIFPRGVNGLSNDTSTSPYETILFTVPDTNPKSLPDNTPTPTQAQAIKTALSKHITILEPSPKDFTSSIPLPGLKKDGENPYHIKAFKGSKDGYLFLLPTGLIWVFKKPLLFFAFPYITSISYTSVLQRTFNLVISARAGCASTNSAPNPHTNSDADGDADLVIDHEFSMLEQTDFDGIDEYIRKYGLQDGSLAEERKGKVYNVNGRSGVREGDDAERDVKEGGDEDGNNGGGKEVSKTVESSDDEEEDENFDPGSEGQSEGEGSGGSGSGQGDDEAAGFGEAFSDDDDDTR